MKKEEIGKKQGNLELSPARIEPWRILKCQARQPQNDAVSPSNHKTRACLNFVGNHMRFPAKSAGKLEMYEHHANTMKIMKIFIWKFPEMKNCSRNQ